jgi:hypothetical protein
MPAYPQTTAMAKRSYEQAKGSDTEQLEKEATQKRKTQINNKIKITLIKNK